MATKSVATPVETKALCDTINSMDALSQEGFSKIKSIASLALGALESPNAYRHAMDSIPDALIAMKHIADDVENCINTEAERVGCNYVNEDERLRWEAALALPLTKTKGGQA